MNVIEEEYLMITITKNNTEQDAQSLQGGVSSDVVNQQSTSLESFRVQLKEDLKAIGEINWIKK